MYLTVLYFFVLMYGLGSLATFFVKIRDFWERQVMRIGIGLATFPLVGALFNTLGIPLNWVIFLVVALVVPLYGLAKRKKLEASADERESKDLMDLDIKGIEVEKPSLSVLLVLLITAALFVSFLQGSFLYPWLENGDPWEYAEAAEYISEKQTYYKPIEQIFPETPEEIFAGTNTTRIRYQILGNFGIVMEPYPQGYQMLLGVLHQTNNSISWTMKFFNSLIIALGIVFFYYFVKRLTGSNNKALFSAFVLAALPSYLSHFIFATPFALTLMFPAFYCMTRVENNRKWIIPAAICSGSIFISHVLVTYVFLLFLVIYALVKTVSGRRLPVNIIASGVLAAILAFSLFWLPLGLRYQGILNPFYGLGIIGKSGEGLFSAGRGDIYGPMDYLISPLANKIDQPKGIGAAVILLALLGVLRIFKFPPDKENMWKWTILLWLVVTFLGVQGQSLPLTVIPNAHRLWCYLSIPIAIMAAEGLFFLGGILKQYNINMREVLVLVILAILITSAYPKYSINSMSFWFPTLRVFNTQGEYEGYTWLLNLPPKTRVSAICSNHQKIIGYDAYTPFWEKEVRDMKKKSLNMSVDEIYAWLKKWKYEYVIIDATCTRNWDIKTLNSKLSEITSATDKFNLVQTYPQDSPSMFVFQVL